MRCKQCCGKGRLPGDTERRSHYSYRVLSWLACRLCKGTGRDTSVSGRKVKVA